MSSRSGTGARTGPDDVDPSVAAVEAAISDLFRLANDPRNRAARQERAGTDLSTTALEMLRRVDDGGPLTVSRAAEVMGLSLATTSRTLAELERRALVVRSGDPDDGRVARFETQVVAADGSRADADVERIGGFIAMSGGQYLTYKPEVKSLAVLPRQPPGWLVAMAQEMDQATEGHVHAAVTRGELDASLRDPAFALLAGDFLDRAAGGGEPPLPAVPRHLARLYPRPLAPILPSDL